MTLKPLLFQLALLAVVGAGMEANSPRAAAEPPARPGVVLGQADLPARPAVTPSAARPRVIAAAPMAAEPADASADGPTTRPAEAVSAPEADEEMVQLNFPQNVELRTLIDYVSKRLGMNIISYDEVVGNRRVTLHSPTKVPLKSLPLFLSSVLHGSGLVLVDAAQPGWKRIAAAQDLPGLAPGAATHLPGRGEQTGVWTQAFRVNNIPPNVAEQALRPFLTKPGGHSFTVADLNLVVVTDVASNIPKLAALIETLDQPKGQAKVTFVPIRHAPAADIAKQVTAILSEKDRVAGVSQRPGHHMVTLTAEPRSNQIAVISTDSQAREVVDLIRQLDVPQPDTNQGGIRFYKLVNATAASVLATIRGLEVDEGLPPVEAVESATMGEMGGAAAAAVVPAPATPIAPTGAGGLPGGMPMPPAPTVGGVTGRDYKVPPSYPGGDTAGGFKPVRGSGDGSEPSGGLTVKTANATVTADPNTNTIIVIGPPEVQSLYEKLINALDKRRPQVMIEATLVALDTSDDFTLGVELLSDTKVGDDGRLLLFGSFGLSKVNANTGGVEVSVGPGFNGVLLDPGSISAVVRALETTRRAKIISAPRVLVNDNATAVLSSVAEQPYVSLNASDTVSTTSFAGYVTAGTTITATPHVSEGEHLQLDYTVTLNSFTGTGSEGIPPPRQTNEIKSEVTIPDGYAIVVGGLNQKRNIDTSSGLPYMVRVPILKYLLGTHTDSSSQSTLFAFIRVTILRDDQFEDLKYLSDRDLARAELPPELPVGHPMVMR